MARSNLPVQSTQAGSDAGVAAGQAREIEASLPAYLAGSLDGAAYAYNQMVMREMNAGSQVTTTSEQVQRARNTQVIQAREAKRPTTNEQRGHPQSRTPAYGNLGKFNDEISGINLGKLFGPFQPGQGAAGFKLNKKKDGKRKGEAEQKKDGETGGDHDLVMVGNKSGEIAYDGAKKTASTPQDFGGDVPAAI